ncbi:YafY family transcriptional regulator [Paenibacillus sp. P25]|nr:YafY family transcriptional regulator [Paenibacillus sp. P25]
MNKTDRMLAILLELQRKGLCRAEDLAETFETSVRTIYRDVQALSEAGVPVIGAPGQGYSLVQGYFLPPVSFAAEEAVALLLGIDFVEQQFDDAYRRKAAQAKGKIEAILPEPVREEASRMRAAMRLLKVGTLREEERPLLAELRQAILEERKVRIGYVKMMKGNAPGVPSVRDVAPYGLVFVQGGWMLVGYCSLRQELRHFRLTRIHSLEPLEEKFTRPRDFNLHTYTPPQNDRSTLVRLLFQHGLADKVKEYNSFYTERMETAAEGLLVTLRVRQAEEVIPWILSWGAGVVVLEPEPLREKIREAAEHIAKRY